MFTCSLLTRKYLKSGLKDFSNMGDLKKKLLFNRWDKYINLAKDYV